MIGKQSSELIVNPVLEVEEIMKKFEYKLIDQDDVRENRFGSKAEFTNYLNELGQEGWSVTYFDASLGEILLMRELPQQSTMPIMGNPEDWNKVYID